MLLYKTYVLTRNIYFKIKTIFLYSFLFKRIGKGSVIFKPILLSGTEFISIGAGTMIRSGARIEVLNCGKINPQLSIGDNVNIEQNVHIVCGSRVSIGNNVSITGSSAIVDVDHPYMDVNSAIKIGNRLQFEGNFVEIGDGSFIGFNSIVLPNVKIGKCVVIGAHSVVNVDIPDFSIAVGNPIKIIKYYDVDKKMWIKV